MTTPDSTDEFSLLAVEAAAFGIERTALAAVDRQRVAGTDGRSLSALVWGEAAPRLALLHGGGLNAHTWDATLMALDVPAVALDLPGHGDSSWRDDADYRAETIGPDVSDALASFAPRYDAVVGQSLGGLTAIVVAALRPELVERLVLVDISPGFVMTPGPNPVRDFLAGIDSFASRDEIVARALSFGFGPTPEHVARGVFHNTRVREDGRVVFKHHLANLGDREAPYATDFRPLWPLLEAVEVPVLLVRGSNGFVSEVMAEEFATRIERSTVVTLPCGHNVQEDDPVALAHVLRDFLAR